MSGLAMLMLCFRKCHWCRIDKLMSVNHPLAPGSFFWHTVRSIGATTCRLSWSTQLRCTVICCV